MDSWTFRSFQYFYCANTILCHYNKQKYMLRDKCSGRENIELMQGYGGIQAGSLQALDLPAQQNSLGWRVSVCAPYGTRTAVSHSFSGLPDPSYVDPCCRQWVPLCKQRLLFCFLATQTPIITQWDHWPDSQQGLGREGGQENFRKQFRGES